MINVCKVLKHISKFHQSQSKRRGWAGGGVGGWRGRARVQALVPPYPLHPPHLYLAVATLFIVAIYGAISYIFISHYYGKDTNNHN